MACALADSLSVRVAEAGEERERCDTGGLVWRGCTRAGCYLLDALGSVAAARVLSLGSGVGVLEITAAALGARVLATDLPAVLPLLTANVDANAAVAAARGGSITVAPLEWGASLPDTVSCAAPWDIVLASDCVFWPTLVRPLVATLAAVARACPASPPHTFLMIESRGQSELALLDALDDAGFEWALLNSDQLDALRPLEGGPTSVLWCRFRALPGLARASDKNTN